MPTNVERSEFVSAVLAAYETGNLIPACAWCGRLLIGEEWVRPPLGGLSTVDEAELLTHSICPDCATDPVAAAEVGSAGGAAGT
jgi:hypothetical protein